jgi:hypothetical protein
MRTSKSFIAMATVALNMLFVTISVATIYMYYRDWDKAGPEQQKLEHLPQDEFSKIRHHYNEKLLKILHYMYLPVASGIMGLSATVLWLRRND